MPGRRSAFTLIEMLVVVAIIATLAGLLIPTITMVRKMANDIKCGNQLQQIAGAMIAYENDNDDKFPGRLRYMVKAGMIPERILICPRDLNFGKKDLNRPWQPETNTSDLYTKEAPCSYLYEVSESPIPSIFWSGFFFGSGRPTPAVGDPMPTWLEAKQQQLRTGNEDASGNPIPFAASDMPIIRCFWHERWSDQAGNFNSLKHTVKKVKNVSWDCNVFESIPQWEYQANPGMIPPGWP